MFLPTAAFLRHHPPSTFLPGFLNPRISRQALLSPIFPAEQWLQQPRMHLGMCWKRSCHRRLCHALDAGSPSRCIPIGTLLQHFPQQLGRAEQHCSDTNIFARDFAIGCPPSPPNRDCLPRMCFPALHFQPCHLQTQLLLALDRLR